MVIVIPRPDNSHNIGGGPLGQEILGIHPISMYPMDNFVNCFHLIGLISLINLVRVLRGRQLGQETTQYILLLELVEHIDIIHIVKSGLDGDFPKVAVHKQFKGLMARITLRHYVSYAFVVLYIEVASQLSILVF